MDEGVSDYDFRKVFIAACLGMLVFGIVMISIGALLPSLMEAHHLTHLQAGVLTASLPVGVILTTIVFGPVVDQFGYKTLLTISSGLVLVGLLGVSLGHQMWMFALSFFLIGSGGGALNGGTNALVAEISSGTDGQRSGNLSFLGVFYGVGALSVPMIMAIFSGAWGYEHVLIAISAFVFLTVLFYLALRFPAPRLPQGVSLWDIKSLLGDHVLLLLAGFLFFQAALESIVNNWAPLFLETEKHLEGKMSMLGLSAFVFGLTITRLSLAAVLRVFRSRRVLMFSLMMIAIGLVLLQWNTGATALLAAMGLLGAGSAAAFPVVLSLVSVLHPELKGTAFSIVLLVAGFGNISFNYVMGMLSGHLGLKIFTILITIALAALVGVFFSCLRSDRLKSSGL
ncbi:MAG: MFS transporter [Saprospiraceae bacterium]|nr:MFS transporter [Saprospiraceae bacterium]